MGRKGSILVPFLRQALEGGKYGSALVNVDEEKAIFAVMLARKSDHLDADSAKMLEDWNAVKGRTFSCQSSYSKAKQGLLMALRRSNYLELVSRHEKHIMYRFLSDEEIKDKIKDSKIKQHSLAHCSGNDTPPLLSPSFSSTSTEHSDNSSECFTGGEVSEFPGPNVQDCDKTVDYDRGVELRIFDTDYELVTDDLSKLVSDHQWKEMESDLFEASLDSAPRSKEIQLFRCKSEIAVDNKVLLFCELENKQHRLCQDDEFLIGYPGVLADAEMLQRLLSCHADVTKIGNDHLLLILTLNSEPDFYVIRHSSDCLILRSLGFFIATGMKDYDDNEVGLNMKRTPKK